MNQKSLIELILLAAIWGASFLFMRIGTPEFGAMLFMALRTLIASLFLYPIMCLKGQKNALSGHWHKIFIMGALNTAIPFALFGYAILTLPAGITSILNATTPIFGALVAYFWLKDKLSLSAVIGLVIGFIGVYFLTQGKASSPTDNVLLPTLAVLGATCCYGIAANYAKHYLSMIKPIALAGGSQISASILLLPVSLFYLPEQLPSPQALFALVALGVICTGIAYVLFFKLIADLGPAKAISVTYLIPLFGLFWGYIFLDEKVTLSIVGGCLLILIGVGLTTGLFLRWFKKTQTT